MRVPSIGIFARVLVVVLVAIGITLITFAALATQAVEESTQRTLQERLLLAGTAAGRVDDRLNDIRQLVEVMVVTDNLDPENHDPNRQLHFLRSMREHLGPLARYVFVVDRHSSIVMADPTDAQLLELANATVEPVQRVVDTGIPVISGGLLLDGSSPLTAIIVPTKREDGETNGAALAVLDMNNSTFTSILRPLGLGSTGYTQIVDSVGLVVASSRPTLNWREQEHKDKFATLIAEQKKMVGTCHDCHSSTGDQAPLHEDVIAFAPMQTAPWGVTLRQAREEAFAPGDALEQRFVLLGALSLGAAAASTWFLTRRLVLPLQALTNACIKIANGNWSVAIPRSGAGELEQLARAFDFMRERLMASAEQIQGWTAGLEEAVRQRTRALEESSAQLRQANHQLATLNALSNALSESVDLESIFSIALDKVTLLVQPLGACVCVFNEAKEVVDASRHSANLNSFPPCEWPEVKPTLNKILENGHARILDVAVDVSPSGEIRPSAEGDRVPLACIPLEVRGRNVGALCLVYPPGHTLLQPELELLTSIGAQIGIAIENALLFKDLREKEAARGALLRKVITAQEEERRRIARELHDETSQALTAVGVGLETVIQAPAGSVDEVKQRLLPIMALSTRMLEEVQRMVRDLRPSLLDDIGLISAIDWYSETRLKRYGVQVSLEVVGAERRLPTEVETTIFRLAQEAISNVAKHSAAENVAIVLDFRDQSFVLEIDDDGKGFDVGWTLSHEMNNGSFGLVGMSERTDLFGGTLSIDSRPDEGTSIRIELPIPASKEDEHGQTQDQSRAG